jgi:hypothetical protein
VAAEAWLGCCAALITKSLAIANSCLKKITAACGARAKAGYLAVGKRICRFGSALVSLPQRKIE